MMNRVFTGLPVWTLLCVGLAWSAHSGGSPPHIVFVIGDDVGWSNTALHDTGSDVRTPTLQKLAADGVHLLRHYTYKFCSPTRSSLFTGRFPVHVNEINPADTGVGGGISLNFTRLLPQALKSAGYKTAHIGKWHLGASSPARLPISRGFDEHFGYLTGAEDHWHQTIGEGVVDLWRQKSPAYGENGTYGDLMYVAAAEKLIREHPTDTPLYLNLALQVVHDPQEAPDAYLSQFPSTMYAQRRTMNAMSLVLDDAVANVTRALRERGMWDNTLFVFMADNGGASGVNARCGNAWPHRGGKHTDFEGGVRNTALVAGGFLPTHARGTTRTQFMHVADWYATLVSVAGGHLDDPSRNVPALDSLNLWPYLGGMNDTSPRTEFPLASGLSGESVGDGGYVMGRHKLVVGAQMRIGFWTGPLYPNGTDPGSNKGCVDGCLFDIFNDPSEHTDLHATEPELFHTLLARLNATQRTVYQAGTDGDVHCRSYSAVVHSHHGFLAPRCDSPEF